MWEYKIIEGDKKTFEKLINELAKDNWVWNNAFNTITTEKVFLYSCLMSKYTAPTN